MKLSLITALGVLAFATMGCSSQDVPQAHKGRMFDKTGPAAFYVGGRGFEGPVLGPGTYFTGCYPEVRMVDCGQRTVKEPLTALTKDGVQFNLDIYVRYGADCDHDDAVARLLSTLSPAGAAAAAKPEDKKDDTKENKNDVDHDPVEPFPDLTITSKQLYTTYVRPALGAAVRESVSLYIANEINSKRDEMFGKIKETFNRSLDGKADGTGPRLVAVYDLQLSNLDFPEQLEHANTDRATQAVLKDKAIAERERVTAEIETTKMRKQLAENEAANDVAKIDLIGQALKRNPEYLQYDLQTRMNDIYYHASQGGNLIVGVPNPMMVIEPKTGKKP